MKLKADLTIELIGDDSKLGYESARKFITIQRGSEVKHYKDHKFRKRYCWYLVKSDKPHRYNDGFRLMMLKKSWIE